MYQNPHDRKIKEILQQTKTIAVVGLSDKPERDSYQVAKYMQERGYRIIPVHPRVKTVLGEKAYKNLSEIPAPVDMVNVFRKSSDTPPVVEAALQINPKSIWLQLGIANEQAAAMAVQSNVPFIQDRCLKIEYQRLITDHEK